MAAMKTRAAVAAFLVIVTGTLSACGSNPVKDAVDDALGNAVEEGVEQAVENAAGEDVDLEVNADGTAVDLPGDFPSGLPLPDGATLVSTLSVDGTWNLGYSMSDFGPADGLADELKSDSSWEMQQESVSEGFKSYLFVNDTYQYIMLAVGEDPDYQLSVVVSPVVP